MHQVFQQYNDSEKFCRQFFCDQSYTTTPQTTQPSSNQPKTKQPTTQQPTEQPTYSKACLNSNVQGTTYHSTTELLQEV